MITQERLKELFYYSPETGLITRIKKTSNRVSVGDIAGCVDSKGYVSIGVYGKTFRAHRLAFMYMTGSWPNHVDHINGIKADNRWDNLRSVTNKENHKNMPKQKSNTSGVTGVCWSKSINKWVSRIYDGGSAINIGVFDNIFDAVAARKSAEIALNYHKNHGRPNAKM